MEHLAQFVWRDRYLLGHAAMDETHREFVQRVEALLAAPDERLGAALDAFARHAELHFAEEEIWMEQHSFPARTCHADEHAKVLASVREVRAKLEEGDTGLVRELAKALREWFPAHADHMDSALAQWLVKKVHAGAPLVFRRDGGHV